MKVPNNPRIALVGSVNSSKKVLEKLIEYDMNVVRVYGLSPAVSGNVSGYQDLQSLATSAGFAFSHFEKINDEWIVEDLKDANVDILFVVGLSQIVNQRVISSANYACIGYHPTLLPNGRGRAALAWIVLEHVTPAVTFFIINEGIDSGDIITSIPIELSDNDYAQDVLNKLLNGIGDAMDGLLTDLKKEHLDLIPQNHNKATYLEIRKPNDGYIYWSESVNDIHRLIRAVSKPLPGAFTFYQDRKIIVWRANKHLNFKIKGVVGRVIKVEEQSFFVQAYDGVLEITSFETLGELSYIPRLGDKLGLDPMELYRQILALKKQYG
jgi:methionyl-tRNA formyltransferase